MYQSTQVPFPSKGNLREATSCERYYNHLCSPLCGQLGLFTSISLSCFCYVFFYPIKLAGCTRTEDSQLEFRSWLIYWAVYLFYLKNHRPCNMFPLNLPEEKTKQKPNLLWISVFSINLDGRGLDLNWSGPELPDAVELIDMVFLNSAAFCHCFLQSFFLVSPV